MSGFAARCDSAFVPHDIAEPIPGAESGPLERLTFAVKDSFDVAGTRTGGGNPAWLAAAPTASSHASAVGSLLAAGATVIGKTVCDELFYGITGANPHYGTPRNPRATGRLPGGSSSGSAAAVASGACDFALGGDTGGSVRIPASLCGLFGIRTTHGRVASEGVMPMAPSFDTVGWLAATPGVFRNVGKVLLDGSGKAGDISRIRVAMDAFAEADPAVSQALTDAIGRTGRALPDLEQVRVSEDGGLDPWREAFRTLQAEEVWQTFGGFIERHKPELGSAVAQRMEFARTVGHEACAGARAVRRAARERIERAIPPGTVLALPTVPCLAPRRDAGEEELESYRVRAMRLTCIAGLCGLPQVTLPAASVDGCPVGLSFIGWSGSDEVLLRLSVRLSKYLSRQGS